jgi:DUF1009 family protein
VDSKKRALTAKFAFSTDDIFRTINNHGLERCVMNGKVKRSNMEKICRVDNMWMFFVVKFK